MNLSSWIETLPVGERQLAIELIAMSCGVTAPAVRHWSNGTRQTPIEKCHVLERATNGAVTCEEQRPDLAWTRVDGRPLLDPSATAVRKKAA